MRVPKIPEGLLPPSPMRRCAVVRGPAIQRSLRARWDCPRHRGFAAAMAWSQRRSHGSFVRGHDQAKTKSHQDGDSERLPGTKVAQIVVGSIVVRLIGNLGLGGN